MSADQLLITLWKRKWIVILTVLIATLATYVVSRSLPKVYEAEATLFVGNRSDASNDFEAIQSAQVLARTYAELIQSENVADLVAEELPGDETAGELLERMSFSPISDTQLLVVSAEGDSPEEAADLANTYAQTFVEYADAELSTETNGEVSVADQAQPPAAPVRPRPTLYAAVMFVFALFLGAGLALLRDRLDTRLGSEEDLARELDVPILARVPSIARRRLSRSREQRFLEAFRVLRTNIAFLSPQEPLSSVVVASAAAAEGKSTCSLALARVMAEQGRRVLVIEGDLRRPALARMYELSDPALKGFTHYLALGWRFEEVVHETPVPNVFLMPAGAPAEPLDAPAPRLAPAPARRGLGMGRLRDRRQPAALGRRRRHHPRSRRRDGHVRRQPSAGVAREGDRGDPPAPPVGREHRRPDRQRGRRLRGLRPLLRGCRARRRAHRSADDRAAPS